MNESNTKTDRKTGNADSSSLKPWVPPSFEREPLQEALSMSGDGTTDYGTYGS